MEQQDSPKIDRRTKEYKELHPETKKQVEQILCSYNPPPPGPLATAWDQIKLDAIEVKEAVFHRTVKSWTGDPETAFYASEAKPSRTALMWYSPNGLLVEMAKGKRLIVPLANVVYVIPV